MKSQIKLGTVFGVELARGIEPATGFAESGVNIAASVH